VTTFMVMAYIIFVNPSILGAAGIDKGAAAAATALVAGIMTIVMGVAANYPLALAAGLGINGIVAFTLVLGQGLTLAGAMGVIVIEGILITILVLVGFREAIMNAVPLSLKRAIGVGIGLFILTIGFVNGGLVVQGQGTPVTIAFPNSPSAFVFLIGLVITIALYVLKIRAALIISIVVTTAIAFVAGVTSVPKDLVLTPSFSTIGQFNLTEVFSKLGLVTALLTIFAIMLSDFFDTMGTVTGIAAEAGLAREDGSVPDVGRVLLVDSVAAIAGGFAGISSNTTYIESAAGVAEGGRTGFASVVTGVLFLLAIFLAPIAGIIPPVATAPTLVLVGYLMFTLIKDIPVGDVEEGIPALLTLILMPLTYDITVGIGAGFISWVIIKVVRGKAGAVHPLMWVVSLAFVVFFLKDWIQALVKERRGATPRPRAAAGPATRTFRPATPGRRRRSPRASRDPGPPPALAAGEPRPLPAAAGVAAPRGPGAMPVGTAPAAPHRASGDAPVPCPRCSNALRCRRGRASSAPACPARDRCRSRRTSWPDRASSHRIRPGSPISWSTSPSRERSATPARAPSPRRSKAWAAASTPQRIANPPSTGSAFRAGSPIGRWRWSASSLSGPSWTPARSTTNAT